MATPRANCKLIYVTERSVQVNADTVNELNFIDDSNFENLVKLV